MIEFIPGTSVSFNTKKSVILIDWKRKHVSSQQMQKKDLIKIQYSFILSELVKEGKNPCFSHSYLMLYWNLYWIIQEIIQENKIRKNVNDIRIEVKKNHYFLIIWLYM